MWRSDSLVKLELDVQLCAKSLSDLIYTQQNKQETIFEMELVMTMWSCKSISWKIYFNVKLCFEFKSDPWMIKKIEERNIDFIGRS